MRLLAQKCGNIWSLIVFVWIVGIIVHSMSSFYFFGSCMNDFVGNNMLFWCFLVFELSFDYGSMSG
jgi:hypothetical protein